MEKTIKETHMPRGRKKKVEVQTEKVETSMTESVDIVVKEPYVTVAEPPKEKAVYSCGCKVKHQCKAKCIKHGVE